MRRITNREKILTAGLQVVHAHGFGAAGVRDIVKAAGVPQGSFSNHFASKEAFGLEVLELYFAGTKEMLADTLLNDERPPLERFAAYVDANRDHIGLDNTRKGCLYGNFTAEVTDQSEVIRGRLVEIFGEIQRSVAYCIEAAKAANEIDVSLDSKTLAEFIVASMQGAILLSKAKRSLQPYDCFKQVLFSTLLPWRFAADQIA